MQARRSPVMLLVVLALAMGAVPDPIHAQQTPRPFRIGVLHPGFFPSIPPVEGLKAGLKALGMEEGRDVVYDIHPTRGKAELSGPEAIALVKAGVDVIFAFGEEMTLALMRAGATGPIVFMGVGDPVSAGIVASINRPGGNVTGVSGMLSELVPKRLETLRALMPTVRRVWAVYHADDLSSRSAARRAAQVAPQLRLELVDRPVRSSDELVMSLRGLKSGDALLAPESTSLDIPSIVLDVQLGNRIPAIFASAFWVQAGGLASYGADMYPQGMQAARLIAKILKGAKPQDLPVETSTKVELTINAKAVRHLGLTIPNDVMLRADQIIQ